MKTGRGQRLAESAHHYSEVRAHPTTLGEQLALDRTHLAVARTFLAWLRTAMAVMGAAIAVSHLDPSDDGMVSGGLGFVGLMVLGWAMWDLRAWARVLPDSSISRLPVMPYFVGSLVVAVIFILALVAPFVRA